MSRAGYRSYVIRAWTRGSVIDARARVRIEVVESGAQVDLRGLAATQLAAAVEAAIDGASRGPAEDGARTAAPAAGIAPPAPGDGSTSGEGGPG
jgi:hypothetical protein